MKPNPAYERIRLPEGPDLAGAALEAGLADPRMPTAPDRAPPAFSSPGLVPPASWSEAWNTAAPVAVTGAPLAASTGPGLAADEVEARVSQRFRSLLHLFFYVLPFIALAGTYEGLRGAIHHVQTVHVADLLALEHRLFSVNTAEGQRALIDIIAGNVHPLLDLLCGVTYLLWVPQVFALTAWLYVRARAKALELAYGFLVVNLAGWAIWLLYPAAPPWYVDMYGMGAVVMDAPASTAGLARLDALLGVPITATIYSKSAYVFGAMPSLHVAYSTLVAGVAFPLAGKLRLATLAVAFSMAFSAVYLRHHYLLDVVAGAALALPVVWLMSVVGPRAARALEAATTGAPRSLGGGA